MKKNIALSLLVLIVGMNLHAQEDPYLWLEEVEGAKAMAFVQKQSALTLERLSKVKEYQAIYDKTLAIYNSTERFAAPSIYGDFVYNFWQDKEHVRGIWRRATKRSYDAGSPTWEILLDLDEMSKKDNEKWVYKGVDGLYPKFDRFLVSLSKGGGDAIVVREFDASTRSFIENGFSLPESKGSIHYLDENTTIVATDFGENSMTTSGYPKQVKIWKRGTPLKDAQLVLDGEKTDITAWGYLLRDVGVTYTLVSRRITFYTGYTFALINNKRVKLDIPDDCEPQALLNNQFVLSIKSDWTIDGITYKQGSLISLDFTKLLNGKKDARLVVEPDAFSSISGTASTKNKLLVNLLTNVKNELYVYSYTNNKWEKQRVGAPDFGTITIGSTDELSDQYYFYFANFLTPSSLFSGNAANNTTRLNKSLPDFFDGSKYKVEQYKARSNDGTLIPYFVVSSKTMQADGANPTLLYAYGGFEIASLPSYLATVGNAWLENGGVYVLANIRGGGEFGPAWHQAGLKEKRQNVYNDFYAVAEDLIAKKITSNKHLGIMGGSNGGLLVGVAFTQRPDLYNAVVCQVPLLDMKRYNKLLAGASWMGEYGDPDKPEEWAYIKKYSPYQNLKAGVRYPEVFFYTSTKDDRVHPGHARKMAAKMIDMGYPVLYYENSEGGHGGSSTNEQRAKASAVQYAYLLMKLK